MRRSLTCTALLLALGCSTPPPASAVRVESREQLIGGRRALGEVGDYKLSNGIIHAVIQNTGHSRGFGVFGGSLIDLDLVRGGKRSASTGVAGNDYFTEMFPAFFLQAVEPKTVEIIADGRDGAAAVIRVAGAGGEFMSMTKGINDLTLGSAELGYQVDYILEPGKPYLKISVTVTNNDAVKTALFPIKVPFGFITLLGEGQRLFVPGKAGYDMRNRLDELYQLPSSIDAFPGEVTSMMTTEGEGVSYGLVAEPRGATYLQNKKEFYPTAERDSMLIPLASGSFLATFWGQPPSELPPGKTYSFTGYLAVGSGDVASVQKILYGIKETKTGSLSGRVREAGTQMRLADVTVVAQDAAGNYVSSARTAKDGSYWMPVPPGRYRVHAVDSARRPSVSATEAADYAEVAEGQSTGVELTLERPGMLGVSVVDETGAALPAKISVEATYENPGTGQPRTFLYDLRIGERTRVSDFEPDIAGDASTQRYLERFFFAPSGRAGTPLRPGKYKVYASRGFEYDLASEAIELAPGQERQLTLVLHHVLQTPGYVSADLHVHSINSVDSSMPLTERVASYAAEGVDFIAATDHNFVSDFGPTVEALKLQRWLKTSVGLELTTLEMGHFNAYPLKLDPGPITHGSFDWFLRPPGELFSQLRSMARYGPDKVIVQVNHPRDAVMGYFTAFNMGAYTGAPLPPTGSLHLDQEPLPDGRVSPYHPSQFSLDFDVLEVFNGKHAELLHHYRVPASTPPGPEPKVPIPAVGELLEQTVPIPGQPDQIQPVYPGVLDDYYTLVSRGQKLTAVGNSDSHGPSAEAGMPRTYLAVGDLADGSMQALPEESVVEALRAQRAIVSSGPFVEAWVNGLPVGSRVLSPDGSARVRVKVQAVDWVDVSEVLIKQGSANQGKQPAVLRRFGRGELSEGLVRLDHEETFTVPDGAFIVVEVSGEKSLWPVVTPIEMPSLQLTEAVGTLGASFGFGNKYGRYKPVEARIATPFAVTNPIWVDRALRQPLSLKRRALPLGPSGKPKPRVGVGDLRALFHALHGGE